MSAEMTTAATYDQAVIKEDGTPDYIDNASDITKEIEEGEKKISRKQALELFEIANNNGSIVKSAMLEMGYSDSTASKDIKLSDYETLCEKVADKVEELEKSVKAESEVIENGTSN